MSDLPAPLTPADSDLRGMEWMPLFGARLFTSSFCAHATDAVFRMALRMWWAAWLQVPSASLPDDDAELCQLAGCDRKKWAKLRAADVLHGFVKCADGRLYHPVLAPQAVVAWDRRVKERERKRDYRGQHPPTNGAGTYVPRDRTRDVPRTSAGGPSQTGTVTENLSSFLDSGSKPRAYVPVREDGPTAIAEAAAARRAFSEEIAAMPPDLAATIKSLGRSMKHYAVEGADVRKQSLEAAELRDIATSVMARPPPGKPLSPGHLALLRRRAGYGPPPEVAQLRVVKGGV